jgi:hypothetical protein
VADDVLAHYGAAIGSVGADELLEFFLIAETKGKIAKDENHDTYHQLVLRCRGQHAFSTDPDDREVARELLDLWDLEPDDATMVSLLDSWRAELYGARA